MYRREFVGHAVARFAFLKRLTPRPHEADEGWSDRPVKDPGSHTSPSDPDEWFQSNRTVLIFVPLKGT